ncbi:unnamed protein product [Schistosoma curassoni]|uniref:Uncharacterized protein n=1 Tax=Schistosoma curassoni TaxID=6186 RepID=A0A183KYY4_9TREM|nr:unnamed protein product [Schistosoma curassoni]
MNILVVGRMHDSMNLKLSTLRWNPQLEFYILDPLQIH